jgi:predicted nucleotidyltransferase
MMFMIMWQASGTASPAASQERVMAIDALLTTRRDEILRLAATHGARNVRVFGSLARGEADAASDIDFLVDMEPGRSLFDLWGLQADLEAMLARPVDVVTEHGLKVRIRERVLSEAVPL